MNKIELVCAYGDVAAKTVMSACEDVDDALLGLRILNHEEVVAVARNGLVLVNRDGGIKFVDGIIGETASAAVNL